MVQGHDRYGAVSALAFDGRLCKKRRHSDIPTHRIWDVI